MGKDTIVNGSKLTLEEHLRSADDMKFPSDMVLTFIHRNDAVRFSTMFLFAMLM